MSTSRMIFGKNSEIFESEDRFLYVIEALNEDEDEEGSSYEIDPDLWRGRIH